MTIDSGTTGALEAGWLRNRRFDWMFIVGTVAVAIASGAIVAIEPNLFGIVLFLDLWLLGYHHVISTYTRLCFDRQSFEENKFLILYLPFIVLGGVLALAHGVGIWTLTTIYLYWQWFHYTRQSWGVSQVYRRKEMQLVTEDERFLKLTFYLMPLFGILYRSWQAPDKFLFIEVWTLPVPGWVVVVVGTSAIGSLLAWSWGRWKMHRAGLLPVAHTLYMASHFFVFIMGYLLIKDITHGWLVINIWHNAQYVLFVWLFNTKRFERGVSEQAPLLSRLSQVSNWPYYFGACLLLTAAMYLGLNASKEVLAVVGLAPMIIIYQTVNFHHYIVDSMIWKVRKPKIQKTLGI